MRRCSNSTIQPNDACTILAMRIAPVCGEGWRRLSIVAFACTALFCMGKQVLDYGKAINLDQSICQRTYEDEFRKCVDSGEGSACKDQAMENHQKCFSALTRPGRCD